MGSITLITGGARSGKSSYAQRLALERSDRPVYLATSRVWDQEHRLRIERHRADRGLQWETVEEPKNLSRRDFRGRTVVVDCVTLWCTNFFLRFRFGCRPGAGRGQKRVRPVGRAGRRLYFRDQRDRARRRIDRSVAAPFYRLAGVGQPIHCTTCRKRRTDGVRHTDKS